MVIEWRCPDCEVVRIDAGLLLCMDCTVGDVANFNLTGFEVTADDEDQRGGCEED